MRISYNPIKFPLPNRVKQHEEPVRHDAGLANICLNCTKKKCGGTCSEYKRKAKEINDAHNE